MPADVRGTLHFHLVSSADEVLSLALEPRECRLPTTCTQVACTIHGTDVPWSVGRLTTHGCIRLYPEDIGELFSLVHRGTVGQLIYEPIKFGESNGQLYVEVHDDLYRRIPNLQRAALTLARQARRTHRIDVERLRQAVHEKRGIPVDVTRKL